MVNANIATQMMQEAGTLLQLSATYQARYGRYAPLKAGSPQDAWELYEATRHSQSVIARLLDVDALANPYNKVGQWWERQDVIDVGTVRLIIQDITQMLASASYHEAVAHSTGTPHSIDSTQHTIAGMLHPHCVRIALDDSIDLELSAS